MKDDDHRPARGYALYRIFDVNNVLIYVGCSLRLPFRVMEHLNEKHWATEIATITVDHFEARETAMAAEARAIELERPKYNGTPAYKYNGTPPSKPRKPASASKPQAVSKRGRGRPRRAATWPWLECNPPMSKTTYYRRLAEENAGICATSGSAGEPGPVEPPSEPALLLRADVAQAGKRGRGRPKSDKPKPWVEAGLSRSAFFRRRKKVGSP